MPAELPFVSVIIPTFNRSALLKETILSLFRQTYPKDRYEIIVVDNDSRDDTEGMIRSLSPDAPCLLRYFRQESQGPGKARDNGVAQAAGSIIAFTDSDCVADPGWIEKAINHMTPKTGIVQGKTLPKSAIPAGVPIHTQVIFRETGLYEGCNIFFRKEALDQVGGFSSDFIGRRFGKPCFGGEDTDLGWRVKKAGWESSFVNEAVVYHHVFQLKEFRAIFNFQVYFSFFFAFPNLVKRHPEIRKRFLYRGIFLNKERAWFALASLSIPLSFFFSPLFLVLSLPYFRWLLTLSFKGTRIRTLPSRLYFLVFLLVSQLVTFLLLLAGNIRYRTIIL